MSRSIRLTRESRNRFGVELRVDDKTRDVGVWAFNQAKHFRDAAAQFDVDREWLKAAVLAFRDGDEPSTNVTPPGAAVEAFALVIRGRLERADAAGTVVTDEIPAEAIAIALDPVYAADRVEPLITWRDRSRLCALDVDFDTPPESDRLEAFARDVLPRPLYSWVTHGGGMRLIYIAAASLAADELAAVASLAVRRQYPTARVELKRDTRHPAGTRDGKRAGTPRQHIPDADTSALAAMFTVAECSPEKRDDWLAGRGLAVGQRYAHELCPVQPAEPGQREPVHVTDTGVYCYACAARGVRFGSRAPGFYPYTALAGGFFDSTLKVAVENFTHWTHFTEVLEATHGITGETAELVYRAALKIRHGDDPRVPRAFSVGRNLLRLEQGWATTGAEPLTRNLENIVAELPAVQDLDAKASPTKIAYFVSPSIDLSAYGYPPIAPVWGERIGSQFLDAPGFVKVFQTPTLRDEAARELRARYVPDHARPFDEEIAWSIVEDIFPGVHRNFVRLLIAARGMSELQSSMPPFLFVSGPSAAGKTGTVSLAASICGDAATSVQWQRNSERVRQGVLQAKASGSFCMLNEILKDGQRDKADVEATLDFLLNMTPESVSHRLYVGPVPLGWLPVVVLTDTVVPAQVKQSKQLARRLIHVPLYRMVAWERTAQAIGQFGRFRIADLRHAQAGNVILSATIDRFFRAPATLKEIAAELGFDSLDKDDAAKDSAATLRAFFDAVCAMPDPYKMPTGLTGRGWKMGEHSQSTDMMNLWRELGERKCSETAWAQLLGVPGEVEFEFRERRDGRVYMRFVADRRTNREYKVNGEISKPV